jgi:hypothetical protein
MLSAKPEGWRLCVERKDDKRNLMQWFPVTCAAFV